MKISFLLFLILTIWSVTCTAQTAVHTSGGEASGNGGKSSYSIGQIVFQQNGSGITSSEGVQQPFEISVINSNQQVTDNTISLDVYPNPTAQSLKLKVNGNSSQEFTYSLYSLKGDELLSGSTRVSETRIDLSGFANATYVLKVSRENKSIKSFQIVKTN